MNIGLYQIIVSSGSLKIKLFKLIDFIIGGFLAFVLPAVPQVSSLDQKNIKIFWSYVPEESVMRFFYYRSCVLLLNKTSGLIFSVNGVMRKFSGPKKYLHMFIVMIGWVNFGTF